jgi:hypothetical protein
MGRRAAINSANSLWENRKIVVVAAVYPLAAMLASAWIVSYQSTPGIASGLILLVAGPYFGRFINTCHRKAILDESPSITFLSPKLGARDFYWLIVFMIIKAISTGIETLGEKFLIPSGIAGIIGYFGILVAFSYFSLRIVFIFPNIALDRTRPLKDSFSMTDNNLWKITSTLFWAFLPFVVYFVLSSLGITAISQGLDRQLATFLLGMNYMIVYVFAGALFAFVISHLWNEVYRTVDPQQT